MNRTLNVDYYDLVLRGGAPGAPEFYDERRIEALLRRCREEGIQRVLWRLSVCGKEAYWTHVRTPFDWAEPRELNAKMTAVMQRFDPLAVACELAPRYGLRLYAWITLMDDYYSNNLESGFVAANPGFQFESRDGSRRFRGTLCYNYPQVRAHRVAQLSEIVDRYDIDGFYLCLRSHAGECEPSYLPDSFGYNEPVVEEYRRRYGVDIRREPFDFRKWYEILGEGLTQFFRDVRFALGPRVPVAAGVMRHPLMVRHVYPRVKMVVDWPRWVAEGLVDELVTFAGEDLLGPDRPDMYGLYDVDPVWVEEAPEYYAAVRRAGLCHSIWFRLGDWFGVWPDPPVAAAPRTKPGRVIADTVRRLEDLGFDDVYLHEAENVETLDLWPYLRGEIP
ncbi:MAG: family 10 glycosylhydrolase [Nitrososphaerales archaeon]